MGDYIDDIFGDSGALSQKFPGYQPRAGQIALAREVDAAIQRKGHLLAEAPTGTGKSVAYSVPAIYRTVEASKRGDKDATTAVIVTANIALQEQLVRKDLPLLQELLPWTFSYSLLKGKNNYLCLDRFHNGSKRLLNDLDPMDRNMIADIISWAEQTEEGDVSELPFEPPSRVWSRFSTSTDECAGKECEFYDRCFAEQARSRAQDAHIVVTNYHLLFADMKVREATFGHASLLPNYGIAILDEGHKAVDIARDFFGFRITEGSIRWVGALLPTEEKIDLERTQNRFFLSLQSYRRSGKYKARIREQNAVDATDILRALTRAVSIYTEMFEELVGKDLDTEQRKHAIKLARRLKRTREVRDQIKDAMQLYELPPRPWKPHPEVPQGVTAESRWYWSDPALGGNNDVKNEKQLVEVKNIFFIEEDRGSASLCSKPISVAQFLQEQFFDKTKSVSVTSATLVARNSFEFIAEDLGITQPATLIAPSPFSWRDQVLLITPQDVPDPNSPSFVNKVAEKFGRTIELAQGRTLGLFTSYKNLNAAHDIALREGKRLGYRVFRQGDMPRTKLIDAFRNDINSVLLGTESFWAGVDVPGESLSCVFIDRLPFATPDDPIMDALTERDRNWFMKYSVPRAIIAFKQGFGRLIRTTTDRGVVVVLDNRISMKNYGKFFIESLPPVQRSFDIEDVRRFLEGEELQNFVSLQNSTHARSLLDL